MTAARPYRPHFGNSHRSGKGTEAKSVMKPGAALMNTRPRCGEVQKSNELSRRQRVESAEGEMISFVRNSVAGMALRGQVPLWSQAGGRDRGSSPFFETQNGPGPTSAPFARSRSPVFPTKEVFAAAPTGGLARAQVTRGFAEQVRSHPGADDVQRRGPYRRARQHTDPRQRTQPEQQRHQPKRQQRPSHRGVVRDDQGAERPGNEHPRGQDGTKPSATPRP